MGGMIEMNANSLYLLKITKLPVVLSALMLVLNVQSAHSQPAPEEPHASRTDVSRRSERRRAPQQTDRMPGLRWLQELEQSDPERFAEAVQLRAEDPEAFTIWARNYIAERRRDALLKRHPSFKAFLATLPEGEREALEKDLFHATRGQRFVRATPVQEERARERQTRRGRIEAESFDARTQYFEKELERAEERIQHLRDLLERRRALREKVIGRE